MTTREKAHKLLDALPESEIEPVLDFIASRHADEPEEWGDLDKQMDAAMTASLRELGEEERKAGLSPWLP
jgi:hypothetical protein